MRADGKYFLTISILFAASLALTAHAQTLTSIVPNSAEQGESLSVTITGQDTTFMQGSSTTVTAVWFAQGSSTINASSFWANSPTSASANLDIPGGASTGSWDVKVTDTIDGTLTLPGGFTVNAASPTPVLTSIVPNSAQQGESLPVTITGQNTNFTQGSGTTRVWFSQGSSTIDASPFSASSDTSLSASFDIPIDAATGLWNVNVEDDIDGTLTLSGGFTITPAPSPTLTSIVPNNAQQGENLAVTITGQNTNFTQGSGTTRVWFSQGSSTIDAAPFSPSSDTSISADFDIPGDALLGSWNVNVENDIDGILIFADGFTITSNNPPVAIDDEAIVDVNSSSNNIYVLVNDSDPDSDVLTITNVTDPNNGTAWIAGSYIKYTPDPNFIGEDSFDYTITDGNGGSDTAVVTVTVRQPPPPPALIFDQELIEFTIVAGQMHQFAVDINNIDSVSHSLVGLSIVDQIEALAVRFMEPGVTQPVDVNAGETFSATLEVDANNATAGNTYSLWAKCLTDGDLQRADYAELSFVVVQDPNLPDLQLTSEDFNFAPLPGVPNQPATISITVWNVGAIPANDVMVVFEDFNTSIGSPQIIPIILPGDSNTVTIQHTWPDASFRLITATVDPNDEIRELDETNNSGSKVYQVGSVPEMEASIIIVCSTPAGFVEGSIATISGQALYEIRVAHEPNYVYVPVNSSSVSTQVIHSSGQQNLPGTFTDMEGYFNVSFPVPGQADEQFDVVITITDGFIENVWQKQFDVYEPTPYTDIWVYSEDITFDNNNPSLGETISIEAVIHASTYNTKKEPNVPVTFYEHHPALGTSVIGSTQYIGQMSPGTSESVLSDWTNGAEGIYCIEVALEPGFSDDNNGNNRAECPIVVGPAPNDINVVIEAPLENADVNASDTVSVVVLVTDDYGNIVPPCALDSIDLQFSGVDGRKVGLKNRFNWSSLRYEYSWRPPSDANGQACLEVTAQTVDIVGSVLTDSNSACVNVVDDAPPTLWIWCSPSSAMISQVVQITVNTSEPLLNDEPNSITVTDSNGQPIPLDPCGPDHPWSTRWIYHTEPLPASTAKGTATVAVTGIDVRSNEGSGGGSFKVVNGDLWVYSDDITFSDHNPDLGETITIEATVYSSPSNTETLGQVPVTFYANHTIGGEYKIGLTLYIEEIPPGSDYLVSTTWQNAAEGAYIMRVTLGPEFSDDNSANNEATRTLFVGTECDFTDDGEVDYDDLAVFASLWLWYGQAGSIPQDIINDGTVNFADFAKLAGNWLAGL